MPIRTLAALAFAMALFGVGGLCNDHSRFQNTAWADEAASNYPSHAVKIIVPYPAGGIPDILGRLVAEQMQEKLGQPAVVENKPGGSTLIGAKFVSSAQPDGYTLLIPSVSTLSIAPQINPTLGVDPVKDFTPIALLGATNFYLIVPSSFPAKTMAEWIKEVRSHPGKYTYASAGLGTPHHIFMELLKHKLGLKITHIPYKGSNAAVPDLLANRVNMSFLDGSQALAYIRSGKMRALGTTMAKRTTLIKGIPPIADTVPGFDWSGWIAVAGPPNMPKSIVTVIAKQIVALQATPRFQTTLKNALMEILPALSPDETAAFVRNEYKRWKPAIELSGAIVK